MTELVLVGAQRRVTMMVNLPASDGRPRKAQPITFWPSSKKHPNRVNRIPRNVWDMLRKKKGSPRQDLQPEQSPLDEYLETGILEVLNSNQANSINEGKTRFVSSKGEHANTVPHPPREPESLSELEHLSEIGEGATKEQVTIQVPDLDR